MVPHLWVPLEGAEEQIKTVNSHLLISPSLDSVVFFFACLLSNTQATKLFSSCSWAPFHNQSLCKSVIHFKCTLQYTLMDMFSLFNFTPVIFKCAKAFLLKRLSSEKHWLNHWLKLSTKTMSVVSQKVCRLCEKCSKNGFYLSHCRADEKALWKLMVHKECCASQGLASECLWITNTIVFLHKATHAVTLSRPWVDNGHRSIAIVSLQCPCHPNRCTSFISANTVQNNNTDICQLCFDLWRAI